MPTIEQLNNMAKMLLNRKFEQLNGQDSCKVMELTIAAIQAKALADISYNFAMNNQYKG